MNSSERTRPLILVVDDEQEVLDTVTTILATSGFACHGCTTAEAAVATAEIILPDLILSDVSLPGANGVEMYHQIQQNPMLSEVPVMFLSETQIPDIIRRSDGICAAYYLRKPFDSGVLVGLIEAALGLVRKAVAV